MIDLLNANLLYLVIPAVLLVMLVWIWSERRRQKILASLISKQMALKLVSSVCDIRRFWRNALFTAAWLTLAFCLLRPYSGTDIEERSQQSRDILVVFDVSNSMNVIDSYGESRLDYGRNLIRKLAAALPSDRFGLMSFAGLAFVESPLTSDKVSYEIALESLSKNIIPLGGTNIEIALNQALTELKTGAEHKAMVLISDGEEIGGDYHEALKELKKKNVKLITLLTGDTRKAGTVRNVAGLPLRDRNGALLTSQADAQLLKQLAKETGGVFINFDPNGNSFQQLNALQNEISNMNTTEGENELIRKPREIYQPFLLVALLLLFVRMFLGERKKSYNSVVLTLAILMWLPAVKAQEPQAPELSPPELSQEDKAALLALKQTENKLAQDANNEAPEEKLRSLAWYNLATNLTEQHFLQPFKPQEKEVEKNQTLTTADPEEQGSFAKAVAAFDKALSLATEEKSIQVSTLHNKATLYQKEAQKILLEDPDEAENHLNEASRLYREALILQPGDEQTRTNLERSFIDLANTETAKEIHQLLREARQKAGQSLFSFRGLKNVPLRNPDKMEEIINDLKVITNKCRTINEKLSSIERDDAKVLFEAVIEHVKQAGTTINDSGKEASDNTEKQLAAAYKLLGGNPDQPPEQQGNNSENDQQENNKDQQNKSDQQNNESSDDTSKEDRNSQQEDQQQQDDKQETGNNSDDNNQDVDEKNDGFFNKNDPQQAPSSEKDQERRAKLQKEQAKLQEAEALLRKLSDTEKEVREHIRNLQAERLRQEMRRQGISISPEENK